MSNHSDNDTESDDEYTEDVIGHFLRHRCDGSEVQFQCGDLSEVYSDHLEYEYDLTEFLNGHYSNDNYPNLERIMIESGYNSDLVCAILLHFVQEYRDSIRSFVLHSSNVSAFFMHDDFKDLINDSNGNSDSFNRTFTLDESSISNDNNIRTTIENCSFFSSWNLNHVDADLTFVLNALAQNVYIQSLKVSYYPDHQQQEERFIDSLTNVVNRTKNLSKLELDFSDKTLVSERAVTGLVAALINSKVITDLSLENFCFANVELLQKFNRLFEKKSNIRALRLDSTMFRINGNLNFSASIFSKLLHSNTSNSKIYLRELEFDFESMMYGLNVSQEVLSLFALLKDSFIEKLTITGNRRFAVCVYERLLVDTIPFMKRLRNFYCIYSIEMLRSMHNMFLKSIGKCSRTISDVYISAHLFPRAHILPSIETKIKMFFKRNDKLTTCVENKSKFSRSSCPKLLYVAKPTGPDSNYHFLCNLDISVGPTESLFMPGSSFIPITTTTTTTEQHKRKFS